MDKSKTIETIERYYSIIENQDTSKESREFIYNLPLELAKSMLNECDKDNLCKLANVLLTMRKESNEHNYNSTFGWKCEPFYSTTTEALEAEARNAIRSCKPC